MDSEFLSTIPDGINQRNTVRYSPDRFFLQTIGGMISSDDRKEALRQLIAKKANGDTVLFCEKFDLNPVYIRALTNPRGSKSFGEKSARRIEKKVGIAPFSLDSMAGGDAMAEIETAIKRADWLSDTDRRYFIGLLKSMKDRQK